MRRVGRGPAVAGESGVPVAHDVVRLARRELELRAAQRFRERFNGGQNLADPSFSDERRTGPGQQLSYRLPVGTLPGCAAAPRPGGLAARARRSCARSTPWASVSLSGSSASAVSWYERAEENHPSRWPRSFTQQAAVAGQRAQESPAAPLIPSSSAERRGGKAGPGDDRDQAANLLRLRGQYFPCEDW